MDESFDAVAHEASPISNVASAYSSVAPAPSWDEHPTQASAPHSKPPITFFITTSSEPTQGYLVIPRSLVPDHKNSTAFSPTRPGRDRSQLPSPSPALPDPLFFCVSSNELFRRWLTPCLTHRREVGRIRA